MYEHFANFKKDVLIHEGSEKMTSKYHEFLRVANDINVSYFINSVHAYIHYIDSYSK